MAGTTKMFKCSTQNNKNAASEYKNCTIFCLAGLAFFIFFSLLSCEKADEIPDHDTIQFFSTDNTEIKQRIISLINASESSLKIVSPLIDDSDIIYAILDAYERHVTIEICIDAHNAFLDNTLYLVNKNVFLHYRALETRMDSFYIISDEKFLLNGTFDFRDSAVDSIAIAFLFDNDLLVTHFNYEFCILFNGFSPLEKDADFDLFLGPITGLLFVPSWYLKNQILLSTGLNKGTWQELIVSTADVSVQPFFTPYCATELAYGMYQQNENKTYYETAISHSYFDYKTAQETSVTRTDFINILAPAIRNAQSNIQISATEINDPILFYELVSAAKRGVKTNIYLDYNCVSPYIFNMTYITKELLNAGAQIKLYRTRNGGRLCANTIVIDENTLFLSSGGFTYESFCSNDNVILHFTQAPAAIREIAKMINKAGSNLYPLSFTK